MTNTHPPTPRPSSGRPSGIAPLLPALTIVGIGCFGPAFSATADDGVLLKASDVVVTQGTTASVQVRATTHDLIGGFEFLITASPIEVGDVRYDGPIFSNGWEGWDNAPSDELWLSAACIFTEDQVAPGDHNLVTLEIEVPATMPAGTVIPVTMSNTSFFNYDFSVASLQPEDGSITVVRSSDLDGDGTVTAADFGILFAEWGPASPKSTADLDADGVVDGWDLGRMIDRWGTSG